ncbi:hypothetical protein GVO57_13090 [Sphingomonas changnyeongensis]|uniref:Uncharacterized protein n=1 Tax=Sphingomonas changnyeongensis TaxID=2698679 RepID=A0A7Z2NYD9_9SPHN|nr:hypothetical protein [Sphingomonas changnyeongensis]QHL91564.1 hypothetical protein GVO57_13090 [Sphingomonas changnyeongensis]
MKVLFYLPVITPWWFENIVAPMIRRVSAEAEVTVLAPAPWSGTGIGPAELERLADLPQIRWCLIEGEDHRSYRTRPADPDGLAGFVADLQPDYVICRSADRDTPRRFPGKVRFLMEGGVAPYPLPSQWVWLAEDLFDHGEMPDLDTDQRAELTGWLRPLADRLRARIARAAYRPDDFNWPDDVPRLLMPIEYAHHENFFPMHRPGPEANDALILHIAQQLRGRAFVTLANHPLNDLHLGRGTLMAAVAATRGQMAMLPECRDAPSASERAAAVVDAMIVGDSKAFGVAAFLGLPFARLSRFKTASWLNAYPALDPLIADLKRGRARSPSPEDALAWAAFHIANNAFDPADPQLGLADIVDRIDRPVAPERWAAGMARLDAVLMESAA